VQFTERLRKNSKHGDPCMFIECSLGMQVEVKGGNCKTRFMGRFASTVEFYVRYREPYSPVFFKDVAAQIGLQKRETLLDVGCGPGLLAIGFAPYVGHCTGIDPETAMIGVANVEAERAGVALSLVHGKLEEFSGAESFDLITIGRALHWMDRERALLKLQQIASDSARILICGARSVENAASPWFKPYEEVRRRWTEGTDERKHRLDAKEWFAGSSFAEVTTILVKDERQTTVADVVGRCLSRSNTSPAVLGERRAKFEAEIAAVLEPFVQDGVLQEQIVARASVFARVGR
jgi:SAM-dependent methyltransferase